ncbi:MAG: hypothetical protein QM796_17190 [Chthoniobacteraceae bacterium]
MKRLLCQFFFGAALLVAAAHGAAPQWWSDYQLLTPGAAPQDYAALNVGQLKYLATKAKTAMDAELAGGRGSGY